MREKYEIRSTKYEEKYEVRNTKYEIRNTKYEEVTDEKMKDLYF